MSVEAWAWGGAAGTGALTGIAMASAHKPAGTVALATAIGAGVGAAELGSAAWLGSKNVNPYLVGAGEALGWGLLSYAARYGAHERYSWTEAIIGYVITAGLTTLAAWSSRPPSAPALYTPPRGPAILSAPAMARPRVVAGNSAGYTQAVGALA